MAPLSLLLQVPHDLCQDLGPDESQNLEQERAALASTAHPAFRAPRWCFCHLTTQDPGSTQVLSIEFDIKTVASIKFHSELGRLFCLPLPVQSCFLSGKSHLCALAPAETTRSDVRPGSFTLSFLSHRPRPPPALPLRPSPGSLSALQRSGWARLSPSLVPPVPCAGGRQPGASSPARLQLCTRWHSLSISATGCGDRGKAAPGRRCEGAGVGLLLCAARPILWFLPSTRWPISGCSKNQPTHSCTGNLFYRRDARATTSTGVLGVG